MGSSTVTVLVCTRLQSFLKEEKAMRNEKIKGCLENATGCTGLLALVLGVSVFLDVENKAGTCGLALFFLVLAMIFSSAIDRVVTDEPPKRSGFVYLLKAGEYYKIGMTTGTVENRLRQLQTGSPQKIKVIHTFNVDDPNKLESDLHRKYASKRITGEWFKLSWWDICQIKHWK